MNAASLNSYGAEQEFEGGKEASGRQEKFRMKRIDYTKRSRRPKQFNGIHRRRRKKIRL
ncbi:MAG: hypothetical protein KDA60_15230 [Planctomycetales bacterium]|nr:hypothetical protein [Planctomycetales bacterium]